MLKIKDITAMLGGKTVLKNINLEIKPGEVHAVMGPHGSGKSSLAHVIQGNPFMKTEGNIFFQRKNISKLAPHKRSRLGIYTTFQLPPPIEGLTNRKMYEAVVEAGTGRQINADLEDALKNLLNTLSLDNSFMDESVNTDAGGLNEYKKNELIHAFLVQPKLIILDELDTDLSEDAFKLVTLFIQNLLEDKSRALIIITHNTKLLDEITPNYVHIMVDGEIRESGVTELYKRIVNDGYSQFS